MNPRFGLVMLCLVGTLAAQDSAPVNLSAKDHPPICRGRESDAPGCIMPPHTTYQPDPVYPEKARKKKERGTVVLSLVVDKDGLPQDVKVEHSANPDLDGAAIDTVKQWKFNPASKDGNPVAVLINVEVSFNLR